MYTTGPLSLYRTARKLYHHPPEGPNSGYLVIQDEESTPTRCFGLCKDYSIKDLPFPQNKRLTIKCTINNNVNGPNCTSSYQTTTNKVYLIPVINQPLSSNLCYYAIKADGTRKGESYASSKDQEKDICASCFCIPRIRDVKPRPPFDPEDIYQQFEFSVKQTCRKQKLLAKSVAPDGHPPKFLRKEGWHIKGRTMKNFNMGEAQGVESCLRARLPDLSFLSSQEYSKPVVVGKWYCPFMLIKDGSEQDQIKKSVFYEMTLEQRWERIFSADRSYNQGKTVAVDVVIPIETVRIAGHEATQRGISDDRRVLWFKTINGSGTGKQIGLSSLIVERMMWEEGRVGGVNEKEMRIRVFKDETCGGLGDWRRFSFYVLVESFVLKRIDGSIALTYNFRHTHQIRSKWE